MPRSSTVVSGYYKSHERRHLQECCLFKDSKLKREGEEEASLAIQVQYVVGR